MCITVHTKCIHTQCVQCVSLDTYDCFSECVKVNMYVLAVSSIILDTNLNSFTLTL